MVGIATQSDSKTESLQSILTSRHSWLFCCLACPQIWLTFMFKALDGYAPLSVEVFYSTRGLFALLVALIFLLFRIPCDAKAEFLSWPMAVLMCAAPYLSFIVAPLFASPYLALLGAILGGATLIWSYMQCVYVYSTIDLKRATTYVLVSFALASIIRVPLEMLPLSVSLIFVAPLPFLCVFMCQRALRVAIGQQCAKLDDTISDSADSPKRLAPLAFELAIYGVVVGLVRVSTTGVPNEETIVVAHLIFRTVFPLAILWLIVQRGRALNISLLCQIALLFIITALLAISLLGGLDSSGAIVASTCARTSIIILLWLVLALLAQRTGQHSKRHPYIIFGVGWALYMLSIAGGMILSNAMTDKSVFTDSFFLNLTYFLVVSTALILGIKSKAFAQFFTNKSSPPEFDLVESRCREIGERFDLSPREVEIMQHVCKGRTKSHIAKTLSLSENTVRSYSKTLYFKLNIHTRQDLLDLIGIE